MEDCLSAIYLQRHASIMILKDITTEATLITAKANQAILEAFEDVNTASTARLLCGLKCGVRSCAAKN